MQSIIVYRNPFEAYLWEGLMNGSFLPLIAAFVVFFIVLLSLAKLSEMKFGCFNKKNRVCGYLSLVISTFAAIATIYFMLH